MDMNSFLWMKYFLVLSLTLSAFCMYAQDNILINNVLIFNGKDDKVVEGNILIENNIISKISAGPIAIKEADIENTKAIDGKGYFLMPGMIDAHWHSFLAANTMNDLIKGDDTFLFIRAAKESENTLLRGFTSVRDLAGSVFGLKKANDMGINVGPRIYPSGAMISQTAGHGDFGLPSDNPRMVAHDATRSEKLGVGIVADGEYEVFVATRKQLRQGATQIKLAAGGGVASVFDPLDATQYSLSEMKAAVQAASDRGTYVTVHVYTPEGIKRAIEAGVKCIEHGHLMDEECMRLIAQKGIWLSMQPFEGTSNTFTDPQQIADSKRVGEGTDNVYKWAKKYNVKLAWGTDLILNPAGTGRQNQNILRMKQWFSNFQILKMITCDNAQLLALSGPRNPYSGKLGVIEEGAYADIILVKGNALGNIDLLADPANNILLIIKNGKIYKNELK